MVSSFTTRCTADRSDGDSPANKDSKRNRANRVSKGNPGGRVSADSKADSRVASRAVDPRTGRTHPAALLAR